MKSHTIYYLFVIGFICLSQVELKAQKDISTEISILLYNQEQVLIQTIDTTVNYEIKDPEPIAQQMGYGTEFLTANNLAKREIKMRTVIKDKEDRSNPLEELLKQNNTTRSIEEDMGNGMVLVGTETVKVHRIGKKELLPNTDDMAVNETINSFKGMQPELPADMRISVTDIDLFDASTLDKDKNIKLSYDYFDIPEMEYSPNYDTQTFILSFPIESPKSSTIRITNIVGEDLYKDAIVAYGGIYERDTGISIQAKGIFLLEVKQGDKAFRKKIIVE